MTVFFLGFILGIMFAGTGVIIYQLFKLLKMADLFLWITMKE